MCAPPPALLSLQSHSSRFAPELYITTHSLMRSYYSHAPSGRMTNISTSRDILQVRQVWVASRIADTGKFSLKGHHGRYLSCDKIGTWSATKEAIGMEESFLPVKSEAGWAL